MEYFLFALVFFIFPLIGLALCVWGFIWSIKMILSGISGDDSDDDDTPPASSRDDSGKADSTTGPATPPGYNPNNRGNAMTITWTKHPRGDELIGRLDGREDCTFSIRKVADDDCSIDIIKADPDLVKTRISKRLADRLTSVTAAIGWVDTLLSKSGDPALIFEHPPSFDGSSLNETDLRPEHQDLDITVSGDGAQRTSPQKASASG